MKIKQLLIAAVAFATLNIALGTFNCSAQNISTIAGTGGVGGYSGDGGSATSAQLYNPWGVAFDDASGNVYIADWNNNRIRKVNTSGVISTFAGGGVSLGDGGPATNAMLKFPTGVTVDASCNIYIADQGNHRIRKVDSISGCVPLSADPIPSITQEEFNIISIYPNPAGEYIEYLLGSQEGGDVTVTLYDALGREVYNKEETIGAGLFKERIGTQNFASGNYLLRITNGNQEETQKQFVIK